ncbi:MAG: hypothetical protein NC311_06955 [Muribaculaceae bacterium]|nr:hypothetical protein [Muribaculaceae bacterium]MCM1398983.1 hypothetical protein [Clostridium sp.]MCM1458841.1 hypothetical protein [Bacteroides sp.]
MSIYGIVVLYNRTFDKIAYKKLMENGVTLIVCDNSTKTMGNGDAAADIGAYYISMGGNKGLACAYNKALDMIRDELSPNKLDYVCLFDDDTEIPSKYPSQIKARHEQILLPIVSDGTKIMSPCRMKNKIVKGFGSVRAAMEADKKQLTGINSCMAVRWDCYDNYRYDEALFLDYIDHSFLYDMRKKGIYPTVLNFKIRQHFSAVEDGKKKAAKRFAGQKSDLRIFYGDRKLIYHYIILKKKFKLAFQYRDIRFLK